MEPSRAYNFSVPTTSLCVYIVSVPITSLRVHVCPSCSNFLHACVVSVLTTVNVALAARALLARRVCALEACIGLRGRGRGRVRRATEARVEGRVRRTP